MEKEKIKDCSIGKRNLNIRDTHWEELDLESFRICKPTVLCFGGNGTLNSRDANYMCKVAQSLVGIQEPHSPNEIATTNDVDFVGIGYGLEKYGYGKKEEILDTCELSQDEINTLVNQIFVPLYLNDQMRIRTKDEICKNFSLITFFSHCHGATEIQLILKAVCHNMLSIGINKETINDAIEHLYSVSYAPMRTISCPGLQVIPEKDNTVFLGPVDGHIANSFLTERFERPNTYQGEGTVAFKENEHTISLIASSITENELDEHPISLVERDSKWNILEENPTYGNEVSIAMGVALSYSIANSIKNYQSNQLISRPSTDEILSEIQSILGQTINNNFTQAIEEIRER